MGVSPAMARASVDLPEPLSPAMASVDGKAHVDHRVEEAGGETGEARLQGAGEGVSHAKIPHLEQAHAGTSPA
jgi:hypothetical protein